MSILVNVFNPSLALFTDFYELTMAYGYWKAGIADREAAFHLSFRKNPFGGGYALACGLASVIEYVKKLQFGDGDLAFLAQQQGPDRKPLFDRAFIVHMRRMRFSLEIDAVPEGTVVFPHEPIVRVKGPLMQCQIVESALLNMINFQTLIATKAARICQAAGGDPVIEFGLRRAQGVDGALTATRASYVGGCSGTSNVLASKLLNIPVKGTHAHSWVMSFDNEPEAFEAYAKALPSNCVFLVDTYDSIEGIRNAIETGKSLRKRGFEMSGIRLDSGDLAYLSKVARHLLNEAGFPDAKILASNDLDEHLIADLKQQGAAIDMWGVGTKLVTAYDQPALGGVYKLSALRDKDKQWQHRIKLSEQLAKVSIPGVLQVRRFHNDRGLLGDAIFDSLTGIDDACTIIDPTDMTRRKRIPAGAEFEHLLVPIFRQGKCVYEQPKLADVRNRAAEQLVLLDDSVKRFRNPHRYPAGLEKKLYGLRQSMIERGAEARESREPVELPAAPAIVEAPPAPEAVPASESPQAPEPVPAPAVVPEAELPPPPEHAEVPPPRVEVTVPPSTAPAPEPIAPTPPGEAIDAFEPELATPDAPVLDDTLLDEPVPLWLPAPIDADDESPAISSDQPAPQAQASQPDEPDDQESAEKRPKFAGIGAKHGQRPEQSTIRVRAKRAEKPFSFFNPDQRNQ